MLNSETFKTQIFMFIQGVDKMTKYILFSVDLSRTEYTKKKRVKSMARINLTGPRLSNKLTILHDVRSDRNILTRWRWDYNIAKRWKDTLMSNTRVKMNNSKFKKNVKITRYLPHPL